MRRIVAIGRELLGLFVDDLGFAIAIAVWVAVAAVLLPRLPLPAEARGPLLFAGLAALLAWSCLRVLARPSGRK